MNKNRLVMNSMRMSLIRHRQVYKRFGTLHIQQMYSHYSSTLTLPTLTICLDSTVNIIKLRLIAFHTLHLCSLSHCRIDLHLSTLWRFVRQGSFVVLNSSIERLFVILLITCCSWASSYTIVTFRTPSTCIRWFFFSSLLFTSLALTAFSIAIPN